MNLILLRHGESEWNRDNRFTGWTDVDLSEQGIQEAHRAADLLRGAGFTFDVAHTSVLKRAIRTLWIVLDDLDLLWLPVYRSWRLNERHYGALQGLNKQEMAEEFGDEQVMLWRRSYACARRRLPKTMNDILVSIHGMPISGRRNCLPPSLSRIRWSACFRTGTRALPPSWHAEQKVLVAAHGNSLRALVKYLDGIPDEEIPGLNIPTGVPLVYELDGDLKARKSYYLE